MPIRIPARLRRAIKSSAFIPSDLRSSVFYFLLCEPLWLCASVVQGYGLGRASCRSDAMNDDPAPALIQHEILPRARDLGGGFAVQRVLPAAARRMVGPFVFFDQFGPVE